MKSCIDQNLSNLDLKLLTDSADSTLSGKLFHTDTMKSLTVLTDMDRQREQNQLDRAYRGMMIGFFAIRILS